MPSQINDSLVSDSFDLAPIQNALRRFTCPSGFVVLGKTLLAAVRFSRRLQKEALR